MKALREFLDKQEPHFLKGGKFEKAFALYEMADTFLYTPGQTTKNASHVRDNIDLKRMMIMVVIALTPAMPRLAADGTRAAKSLRSAV